MTRDSSPPDSPLSSAASSEQFEDDAPELEESSLRPSKRQKVEGGSAASSAIVPPEAEPEVDPLEGMSSVSSDTSGDIPSSPVNARLDEEDFQDQVTVCDWDQCKAGDQGNMDKLVEHIHNSHIESRQKRYTCEWITCSRKGLPHASGYALKAHMRSHTREKPFYCYLPECDRSFTRSDALAKHMRTVHETEALRPSDPIPKSHAPGKGSKLKIIIKTPQSHGNADDGPEAPIDGDDPNAEYYTVLPKGMFKSDELSWSVDKLYRKCYWESKWANEIAETLEKECKEWEEIYHKEWEEKEALLSQVIQSEVDWHERRQAILSGTADVQISTSVEGQQAASPNGHKEDVPVNTIENGLRPRSVAPA